MTRSITAGALGAALLAFSLVPGAAQSSNGFRVDGTPVAKYAKFDAAVEAYMRRNGVRAAQLAFGKNGHVLFMRAYTYASSYSYPTVHTQSPMRLASVSKALTAAAITTLLNAHTITDGTKAFPYLGVHAPLFSSQHPDSRIDTVTVRELIEHTAGIRGSVGPDPEFQMRDVELQLHHQPLTKAQFARYLYGLPLVSAPGVTYHYSNSGYTLLGMIVTKATHRQLMSYIDSAVLAPLGITNVEMTRTNPALRDPREIVPDEQPNNSGPSIFDLSSNPATRRFSDGGGGVLFEVSDGPTSMSTTADSLVRFLHSYAAWGSGGRSPGAARDGCMAGVATWIESRKDGVDWAFLTNKDDDLKLCFDFTTDGVKQLDQLFDNNSV
jgi:CubicO group peptidase (beta-lactamase class C family)